MATWISFKLRVAETFFEQIDQKAAESSKKNERTRSEDGSPIEVSAKAEGGTVSLKDQLKKKSGEASELHTTMVETLEAMELEKQKHNTTRKEALAKLAKLETANADLAKLLAAAQQNLELEVNQVAGLRQQFEQKDTTLQDLRRRISESHETGTYASQSSATMILIGMGFGADNVTPVAPIRLHGTRRHIITACQFFNGTSEESFKRV